MLLSIPPGSYLRETSIKRPLLVLFAAGALVSEKRKSLDRGVPITRRPRLLHVAQPTSGGTAVVMRDLAAAAARAGYDVIVATPDSDNTRQWAQRVGVRWVELSLVRSPAAGDLRRARELARLMHDVDVVHLHSSKAGAVGRIAARTMRQPPRIVFTPHAWSWYVGGRFAPGYRAFERWAAHVTDAVVVVSAEELLDGRATLGPRTDIVVIENGVDPVAFTPEGPQAPRAAEPLIVCVGRLCQQKGQDRALRMLARLPNRTVRLRLIGDGPDRTALEGLAADLAVDARVEFIGAADPGPHLRAADVVVLPSRWEGMSLVLLEAMATGATIVTTDVGGSGVLAGCGVVVAASDDESVESLLVDAASDLLADGDRCRALGLAARAKALRDHSPERVLAQYQDVWTPSLERDLPFA